MQHNNNIRGNGHFINLFTDFGFKRIFTRSMNKELLLSFLNSTLKDLENIKSVEMRPTEHLGAEIDDRKAIFDLLCETDTGEMILIELQKASQTYIRERMMYYSSFIVQNQAIRGEWDFNFHKVYVIAIMDFELKNSDKEFHHRNLICDAKTGAPWSKKMQFITIEAPKMTKTWDKCENTFEKWIFFFRNMHFLEPKNKNIHNKVFQELLNCCKLSKFKGDESKEYEVSLMKYGHLYNIANHAKEEGHIEGREEGREKADLEHVRNMLKNNLAWDLIEKITGLTQDSFHALEKKYRNI